VTHVCVIELLLGAIADHQLLYYIAKQIEESINYSLFNVLRDISRLRDDIIITLRLRTTPILVPALSHGCL